MKHAFVWMHNYVFLHLILVIHIKQYNVNEKDYVIKRLRFLIKYINFCLLFTTTWFLASTDKKLPLSVILPDCLLE